MIGRFGILAEFAQWVQAHHASFADRGLHVTSGVSPLDGRTKRGAWLGVQSAQRMGQLIVWDTGEAQVELAELSSGDVVTEHKQVDTREDLQRVVDSLLGWVATAEKGGVVAVAADPQRPDPGFADALARAAAIPDPSGQDLSPEEDVDEMIAHLVAKSSRRISFPDPVRRPAAGS